MENPLVTIMLPTYRRPELLTEALASAVGQTYQNLQIIVRDNASGDHTPDVVRSFNDSRIEFHQAAENQGAWVNAIECLKLAKGKYISLLCDDDYISSNYIQILANCIEDDPKIMAAYGGTKVINALGGTIDCKKPKGEIKMNAKELTEQWCRGDLPVVSTIHFLCQRTFLCTIFDKIRFPSAHNSDNAILFAAAIQGSILFTEHCEFFYRVYDQNSWRSFDLKLLASGDEALLEFLDTEVASEHNIGLDTEEWPLLREKLNQTLTRARYSQEIRRLSEKWEIEKKRLKEKNQKLLGKLGAAEKKAATLKKNLSAVSWVPKWLRFG